VSLELLASATGNPGAQILADTLDRATGELLDKERSPSRKCGELDNRGSQFYLTLYWAQALAAQTADPALAARFAPLAERLAADEATIVGELNAVQGRPADIGGYYSPDPALASAAMRPSPTLNDALHILA
jgi:isocitrate dehydrogenase